MNWNDLTARTARLPAGAVGVACGVSAALFWAAGLVSARHAVAIGLTPMDITFHRFVWAGLAFLPALIRSGGADLRKVGWGRSIALTAFGGPALAFLSYSGFLLVPLGHGGVIQPSSAALGGLMLSTLVLKDKLLPNRAIGALVIVLGLCIIGYEALSTIGAHGLLGDLSFMTAGFMFAIFGMLLKFWRVAPTRAVVVMSVLSLVLIPLQFVFVGFDRLIAAGLYENAMLAVVQGIFAGALSTFLFARSVVLLGAARAAVFPSLVPPFTLLIGFVLLGEVPTWFQLVGLTLVVLGFRLTQKA